DTQADLLTPDSGFLQLWIFKRIVFVEIGPSILSKEPSADAVIQYFRPNWIRRFLGLASKTNRSCVVVIDAEADVESTSALVKHFVHQVSRLTKSSIPIYAFLRAEKLEHYSSWSKVIETAGVVKHAAMSIPASSSNDCQVTPDVAVSSAFDQMHEM